MKEALHPCRPERLHQLLRMYSGGPNHFVKLTAWKLPHLPVHADRVPPPGDDNNFPRHPSNHL